MSGATVALSADDYRECFKPYEGRFWEHLGYPNAANALEYLERFTDGARRKLTAERVESAFQRSMAKLTKDDFEDGDLTFQALAISCFKRDATPLRELFSAQLEPSSDNAWKTIAFARLLLWLDTTYGHIQLGSNSDFWGGVDRLKSWRAGDAVMAMTHAYVHADPEDFHRRAANVFRLTSSDVEQGVADMRALVDEGAWMATHSVLHSVIFPFVSELAQSEQMRSELKTYFDVARETLGVADIVETWPAMRTFFGSYSHGLYRAVLVDAGVTESTDY